MSQNTAAAIDAAKPDQPVTASVLLDTPIQRGDQTIDTVVLRKPRSGELRGIALADLTRLDVGALTTLIPRISSPTLTANDVANLDPADLVQIGGEVIGFLLPKAERAALSPAT